MKIGIYQNKQNDSNPEEFEVYNALKRRADIDSIEFLPPRDLKMTILDGRLSFNFAGVDVTKEKFDVILFRGGFGNVPLAMEFIKFCRRAGIRVFDNNLVNIRYMINKRADNIKLALAGISVPDTYIFSNVEMLREANLQFPLVMKATNTGKGKNVFKVSSIEEIESESTKIDKKLADFLLQEIIDYEHDLRVIVCGDQVLGAMKRIPKAGDFRANFSLGGTVEPFEATEEIKELAIKAAKACDLQISGVDVLVEKNTGKLWILEANRTPGLEGITQALGHDISDKVVEFMLQNAN